MRLLPLVCTLAAASAILDAQPATEGYQVEVRRDVMVPMRDGVRLACDLYLPVSGTAAGRTERVPTLVSRTPYDKTGLRNEATRYAERGYAVVAQDVRGRFRSQGSFYPFTQEGPDGYDTIEWAAAQDWSNGKVGTFGASYLAWDQYRAAMERPPHLVAMFANVGGSNFYQEFAYPGGAMNPTWGIWIVKSAETSPAAQALPAAKKRLTQILENPSDWLSLSPRDRASVFDELPVHRKIYDDFLAHPRLDSYWRDPAFHIPSGRDRMKDVPVFFISGWYDYYGPGVLENYIANASKGKSASRLVMGPWWHAVGGASCGDAFFGSDAAVDVRELTVGWFDRWLRGGGAPSESAPVRYFRMGGGTHESVQGKRAYGGTWRTASAWPIPSARIVNYYLTGNRGLSTETSDSEPQTFEYDPENPVPTIGGRYGIGSWTPNCVQNQVCRPGILGCTDANPLASRSDVLVFESRPLEAAVEVTGDVRAELWVSTNAKDTDFTAKLVDVAPDGYAAIVADGHLRLRHIDGFHQEKLTRPGSVTKVRINLGPTSVLFAKGHKIRIDVSSSNWPQSEPNANTGEPVNTSKAVRKARNTVFLDAKHPSHIQLPVVPLQ